MSPWITISDTTETNASEIRSNDHDNATPWIAISYTTEAIKQTPQKFNPMTPLQCQRVII